MEDRKLLGELGENLAEAVLYAQGYMILERNFHCKFGEADLICERDDELVFVEVKTRSGSEYGYPEEAVNLRKQKTYWKIAEYYRMITGMKQQNVSFQVFGITVNQIARAF